MTTSDPTVPKRSNSSLPALLAVNALLLGVLALVTFGPDAEAQNRRSGEYLLVSGGVKGTTTDAVYIIDVLNDEMLVVQYDPNSTTLTGVGYRDLERDAASVLNRNRTR